MTARDALVAVLTEHRVPINADLLIQELGKKGVTLQLQGPVTRDDAAAAEPKPTA